MEDKMLSLYKETFSEAITKENYMVNINGVYFHRFILEMYSEYFRINQDIFNIFSNIKTELVEQLKKVVYYQPLNDISNLDTQILIDFYFLLDMILTDITTLRTVKKFIKHKKDNLALRFFGIIEDFNAVSFLVKKDKETQILNYDIFFENCFKPHFLGRLIMYNILPLEVIEKLKQIYMISQSSQPYIKACLLYNSKELIHARMLFETLGFKDSSGEKGDVYSRNYLAYMISEGQGGYKDEKEARRMFKENWEKHCSPDSLYNYAHMMYHGEGNNESEKDKNDKEIDFKALSKSLFQICWERYECADSFYMLNVKYYDKFLTCVENLKQNWEENVNGDSYKFLKKFGFVI
jgi:hypothetical protein